MNRGDIERCITLFKQVTLPTCRPPPLCKQALQIFSFPLTPPVVIKFSESKPEGGREANHNAGSHALRLLYLFLFCSLLLQYVRNVSDRVVKGIRMLFPVQSWALWFWLSLPLGIPTRSLVKTSVYPNQITHISPSKVTLLTRYVKWKSLFSQSAVHSEDNTINHWILYKNARAWKLSLKRICDRLEMKAYFIILFMQKWKFSA